jgi:hypothetical protein
MFDSRALSTEELGYSFYPSEEPHNLGHPELKVIIRPTPGEKHYDPETVTCTIASPGGGGEVLRIQHPWVLDTHYRVCAGHFTLEDRKGKCVVAFTFGGELHLDSNETRTICRLTSTAPILEQSQPRASLERLLSEEVEILLAERRAAWLQDEWTYEKRLAAADPQPLYYACLAALREKIDRWPEWEEPVYREFKRFLHAALRPASGEAPLDIPLLTDLL